MVAPLLAAAALALPAPPSPASWPRYPVFPAHACWTRHPFPGPPLRVAPSFAPPRRAHAVPPRLVVSRLLARFGDRSLVRGVTLSRPPAITLTHLKGYYGGRRPPRDALWATIAAPAANTDLGASPSPQQVLLQARAQWEAQLVAGALRDDFCAAGGPPLVGWTVAPVEREVSDHGQALEQRFPNPPAAAFEAAVADAAGTDGFRVAELKLLRPQGLAPLLVVQTGEDRKSFVLRIPSLLAQLDPRTPGPHGTAYAFEGFFFAALDVSGTPFAMTQSVRRGQLEGGEWAWDPCWTPYPHSEPVGAQQCPPGAPG